ncbi:MAG: DUF2339 domain-containing protein [Candidatus Omnitrophica bacterium]|nr:DUF2339 domain-containing protein [Candidatus Omnitrophota bacterium]
MFGLIWVGCIIAAVIVADQKGQSVIGFFFIALFTGPLALIIVLLLNSGKKSVGTKGIFTVGEAQKDLGVLKRNIAYLEQKAARLEEKLKVLAGEELPHQPSAVEVVAPETKGAAVPKTGKSDEGFEVVFGKYWLNRIGVVLFVIGIGLFISYTFQYLNAFAKVGIGYFIALAFFIWGNTLEKKEKYQKISWGILGGAWGVLYLSTFAMHYIEATRVITNPWIAILLLAGVSVAAVYRNLKYNSWTVTALTFILAFLTAGLGGMDYSSIVYFALLSGSIAYLALKKNWHPFLLMGMAGSYIAHACWQDYRRFLPLNAASRGVNIHMYQFQIVFGVLLVSWIIYLAVLLLMKEKEAKHQGSIVAGSLINAGFFSGLGLYELNRFSSSWQITGDERFYFLSALTAVYFLVAYANKVLKTPKLIVVNAAMAFTFLGLAILVEAPRSAVAFFWVFEMAVIFMLGVYYKEFLYRMLSFVLGIFVVLRLFVVDLGSDKVYMLLNTQLYHNLLIFFFAALCFYIMGAVVRREKLTSMIPVREGSLYAWVFPVYATFLMVVVFSEEIDPRWLSLAWTLLGAGVLTAGFTLRHKPYRVCALTVLVLACLRLIFHDLSGVNTIYKIVAFTVLGGALLGISIIYSKVKKI